MHHPTNQQACTSIQPTSKQSPPGVGGGPHTTVPRGPGMHTRYQVPPKALAEEGCTPGTAPRGGSQVGAAGRGIIIKQQQQHPNRPTCQQCSKLQSAGGNSDVYSLLKVGGGRCMWSVTLGHDCLGGGGCRRAMMAKGGGARWSPSPSPGPHTPCGKWLPYTGPTGDHPAVRSTSEFGARACYTHSSTITHPHTLDGKLVDPHY